MSDTSAGADYYELGRRVEEYCKIYSIPLQHFFEILNDQKVVPMLRGKGLEYAIFDLLSSTLDPEEWVVGKPDLNAQPGQLDIDVDIIHRETGEHINTESKSSVRGSMKSGRTTRLCKFPHFKVKCHRSRSNKTLGTVGSDRYKVGDFDIVITNPLNSLFLEGGAKSKTRAKKATLVKKGKVPDDEAVLELAVEITEDDNLATSAVKGLRLLENQEVLDILHKHYGVADKQVLLEIAATDFRFALAEDIAEDGYIPHDPIVMLENDSRWLPLTELPKKAAEVARQRVADRKSRGNS